MNFEEQSTKALIEKGGRWEGQGWGVRALEGLGSKRV